MGAWTAEERLTLIGMLTDSLYTQSKRPGPYEYKGYESRVRQLVICHAEFLEQHRSNFAGAINRYNVERPEGRPAI